MTRTHYRSLPFLLFAGLLNLSLLLTLCIMAPRTYPLHNDTPANFWFAMTGVDLGATRHRTDFVILDRDRFIYSSQGPFEVYPDYAYHTITEKEAETQLPAVARELALRAAKNDPDDYVAKAYTNWILLRTIPGTSFPSANDLLLFIDQTRSEFYAHTLLPPGMGKYAPAPLYNDFQNGLLHVASAARLFEATFVFELLFFSMLIWFVLWPYIHDQSLGRKLFHAAVFPLLLYLPAWFSYCNPASQPVMEDPSSSACFNGGILYPYSRWGLFAAPISPIISDYDGVEIPLLEKLPPFLSVITQGRAVAFSDYGSMHYSEPFQVLPLDAFFMSLECLTLATLPTIITHLRARKNLRACFPVS